MKEFYGININNWREVTDTLRAKLYLFNQDRAEYYCFARGLEVFMRGVSLLFFLGAPVFLGFLIYHKLYLYAIIIFCISLVLCCFFLYISALVLFYLNTAVIFDNFLLFINSEKIRKNFENINLFSLLILKDEKRFISFKRYCKHLNKRDESFLNRDWDNK